MLKILFLSLVLLGFHQLGLAQAPPSSDIYLVPLNPAATQLIAEKATNITARVGYDNQPFFLPDGSLFYTSIREDNQSDTYHYDPKTQTTRRVTQTTESEYSPTLMPDGKHFSVIRVGADNEQRLWQFELDGTNPKVLLETVTAIGYHAWLSPKRLGLFIVGQPHTLQLVTLGDEKPEIIFENIGRCLSILPGGGVMSVVHKKQDHQWDIVKVDPKGQTETIMTTRPGSEDYAWTPSGVLIMAQGKKVYRSTPLAEGPWQPIADFANADFKQINRLAVSADGRWLAMVVAQ